MAPSTLQPANTHLHAVSLLQRLCVGPDGADKRNERIIDRCSQSSGDQSPGDAEPGSITIAFAGLERSFRRPPQAIER